MRRALVMLLLFGCGGCYTTTVSSGRPAAGAPIAYDERVHNGVAAGLGELDGPHDLGRICPGGWAEIKTETTFGNIVAGILTANVYAPQTITVRCAATAGAAPPPPPAPAVAPPPAPPPAPPSIP